MKVTKLEVRNLTVIEGADFNFAPGVNVLIGENGTGKTHLLKAIYSLLRAASVKPLTRTDVARNIAERLAAAFLPDDDLVERLVRVGHDHCSLWLSTEVGETFCTVSKQQGDVMVTENRWSELPDALFLPSRDVMAMFEGFVAAYQDRELSFDESYYDVCVALSRARLRGQAREKADELSMPFRDVLGGEVKLEHGRFYVDVGDGMRESHLVAEGVRKLATLAHLVQNGSIKEGTIVFWDEPESNLNPKLIIQLVDAIAQLARNGVQFFLATHDYLLSHRLSLAAEYHRASDISIRFFSFQHSRPTDPVEVETGNTLAQIAGNSILEAYAGHADYEQELFHRGLAMSSEEDKL